MKQESVLALLTVMLISGCQNAEDMRSSNHGQTSLPTGWVGRIGDTVPQGEAQSPRVETVQEKRFVERPVSTTTYDLVNTERAAAVPLIVATLDRLAGETNAPTRCEIIQGALRNPEVCTDIQFHAIIQRGTNDLSESVRLTTSLMVSNARVELELIGSQTK